MYYILLLCCLLKRSPGPYQCWRAALCPSACAHTCACACHHTDTPHVGHERARASHSAQRASSRAAGSLPRPCQAEGHAADIKMSSCRKASAGPMLPVIYIGPEHTRRKGLFMRLGGHVYAIPKYREKGIRQERQNPASSTHTSELISSLLIPSWRGHVSDEAS